MHEEFVSFYSVPQTDADTTSEFRRHCYNGAGNRSVKQREDILTNKPAANTHVIARKTQIAQCASVHNWGDTWNIYASRAIVFYLFSNVS